MQLSSDQEQLDVVSIVSGDDDLEPFPEAASLPCAVALIL